MKTFKKTVVSEEPMLTIERDHEVQSPRELDNIGYFITIDKDHRSPDKNEELETIIKETGDLANNLEQHMDMIERRINEEFLIEKVLGIYPVIKYEHSGVAYHLGTAHGYDYSNNGFYIVTEESIEKTGVTEHKNVRDIIESELEAYNKFINGEVYQFTRYNKSGFMVSDGCGFYSLEDIRAVLPEGYKDEDLTEYIIN